MPATSLPWLVRATVDDNARAIVKAEFNEPIQYVDVSKFQVLVNTMPVGTASPFLTSGVEFRKITAASGSGKFWNLTMESPALYGEILRLEAVKSGAASTELYEADLPQIPQLIIKNLAKRTKAAFESGAAGLYVDGVKQSTANGPTLLKDAISAINGYGADARLNKTWTIVLDQNQTGFNPGGIFSGSNTYTGSTLIVTTNGNTDIMVYYAANGGVFTARNGLTIIIDKHIVFSGIDASGTQVNNNQHMMMAMDAGKIILDGCEFRNNNETGKTSDNGGALRVGGGSNGAIILMNDGKIIGNTTTCDTTSTSAITSYAGAVTVSDYGAFIMHDGEISGNTAKGTNTVTPRAGAIASRTHNTDARYRTVAVYITGGLIQGNAAQGGTNAISNSGGILVSGLFQKTGGTIEGNIPSATMTGSISVGQLAVVTSGWGGNPTTAQAAIYDAPCGPDVQLIIDPIGSNNYGKAAWLPSNWN